MDGSGLHLQFLTSAILIAATTFVHGVFVAAAAAIFRTSMHHASGSIRFVRDSIVLVLLILWLMAAHTIEIWMWSLTFLHFELFDNLETALYFSASSYTTLGFGDVLLPEGWRLLAGATAANGFLLFGLSAAFLFDAARQLHLGGTRN